MKQAIDRESVKMLAMEIGVREAARKLGLKEKTVLTWSARYKWGIKANGKANGAIKAGRPSALVKSVLKSTPSQVLNDNHKALEDQTRTGIAKASAKASGWLSEQDPDFITGASARLRDLAAAASRVFGWDANKGGSAVTLNQIVVSPEQLEQIRALRAS